MLYENIKQRGKAMKLSVSQIERNTGIALKTISKWNTHRPSVDKVKLVADLLGCTVDELLQEE